MNPVRLLHAALARDGARPFLTWYDDAAGERVELSVATLGNWAVKTANYLVEELDVAAGGALAVTEPMHWLTPVLVLGAWAAGADVVWSAAGAPVALPGDDLPAAQRAILAMPDVLLGVDAPTELPDVAMSAASGSRVLSTLPLDTDDGLTAGLLVPLAAAGSVVLVRHADGAGLARHAATERVTHTAGCDVDGIPRIV